MPNPTSWMPPEMSPEDKALYVQEHPGDPHGAAAAAWDDWAGRLAVQPTIISASTGAQSASYGDGGSSPFKDAQARASWHRSRAKVKSVSTLSMSSPEPLL